MPITKYLKENEVLKTKVVLYGIGNKSIRCQVYQFLSSNVEILGISDSKYKSDYLQGERYIEPEKIHTLDYDYILILSQDESHQEDIINSLSNLFCDRKKVIVPRLLLNPSYAFQPDLKKRIDSYKWREEKVVALGMSYSIRGIDFNEFPFDCIDLSWHANDLYFNYMALKELIKRNKKQYKKIKAGFLVFPYYIFNHDISMERANYISGCMLANRGFGTFHNGEKSTDACIRDYIVSDALFGKKYWRDKNWKWIEQVLDDSFQEDKVELFGAWKKTYKNTMAENVEILKNIMKLFKSKKVFIIVPPICVDAIKPEDMKHYWAKRKQFYEILSNLGLNHSIIDCSTLIDDRRCFADFHHLNRKGRDIFTSYLKSNSLLMKEVYGN